MLVVVQTVMTINNSDTYHAHQHIAIVPQGGQDIGHQLLISQPSLGLVVGRVVAVSY